MNFIFTLNPEVSEDDFQTEFCERLSELAYGHTKQGMEAILCIGVAYDNLCATARTAAGSKEQDAQGAVQHVPFHNAALADADLWCAFDTLIAKNKYNVQYSGAGSTVANREQDSKALDYSSF